VEVAGYYTSLRKGFEEIGITADFVDLSGNPFAYGRARKMGITAKALRAMRKALGIVVRSPNMQRRLHRILQTLTGIPLLVKGLWKYDVFIFGFGTSLMAFRDLPILKALGKRIIYVFHGSDIRPPYIDGAQLLGKYGLTARQAIRQAERLKRMIRRIERYADVMVDLPTQGLFHEKPFVNWLRIGIPFQRPDVKEKAADSRLPERGAVRILHSPSHPEAKGTDRVRDTIESLRAKGYAIEYV
ncbi:unnamed protein product, partial [marine sediment metagenome]